MGVTVSLGIGSSFPLGQSGLGVKLITLFIFEFVWMVFCVHFPRYLYSVVLHLVSTGSLVLDIFCVPYFDSRVQQFM